jgi:hypothetical protein
MGRAVRDRINRIYRMIKCWSVLMIQSGLLFGIDVIMKPDLIVRNNQRPTICCPKDDVIEKIRVRI